MICLNLLHSYLYIVMPFYFYFYFYFGVRFLDVACPTLTKIPNVLVLHGEGDGTLDHMKVLPLF